MSKEFDVLPSLCGGSIAEWQVARRTKDEWNFRPFGNGIEAFCGRAGISGNWCTGYIVVDESRRPFDLGVMPLQQAVETVENRGEELTAARDDAESKEKDHVPGLDE